MRETTNTTTITISPVSNYKNDESVPWMTKLGLANELQVNVKTLSRYEVLACAFVKDYLESKCFQGQLKLKTRLSPYHQYVLRSIKSMMETMQNYALVGRWLNENRELFQIEDFNNTQKSI